MLTRSLQLLCVSAPLLAAGCTTALAPVDAAGPQGLVAVGSTTQIGARVLEAADALERESSVYIQRGNALRKKVGPLRVAQRQVSDDRLRGVLQSSIDALAAEIAAWEERGNDLRTRSQELQSDARMLLIDGMHDQWGSWITNSAPLVMDAVEYDVVSHNANVRSVKPSLLAATPAARDLPAKHQGMSIKVPDLVGQPAPDVLDVSSFQVSRERRFVAHVEVEPGPGGPASVPLNRIHRWRLLLSDLEGKPIHDAKIDIVGHMPGHVHGLPTQPQVTGEVAPGVYTVDGMKFQMNGWCVMDFNVEYGGRTDLVRYNLVL